MRDHTISTPMSLPLFYSLLSPQHLVLRLRHTRHAWRLSPPFFSIQNFSFCILPSWRCQKRKPATRGVSIKQNAPGKGVTRVTCLVHRDLSPLSLSLSAFVPQCLPAPSLPSQFPPAPPPRYTPRMAENIPTDPLHSL